MLRETRRVGKELRMLQLNVSVPPYRTTHVLYRPTLHRTYVIRTAVLRTVHHGKALQAVVRH